MSSLHKDLTVGERHSPVSYEYADSTARTGATGFVTADLGKFAWQQDDDSVYILTATTPTWVAVGGSGGGSGGITTLAVTSIADPSTELNAIAGSANGDLRLCYQVRALGDLWTLYAWDSADSNAESVPYTVDGSSGRWAAIGGSYISQAQSFAAIVTLGAGFTMGGHTPTDILISSDALSTSDTALVTPGYVDANYCDDSDARLSDARTPTAHTIASHSDTTATGTELDELVGGGATTLHSHAGGSGDVVGPASATDNAIARYDSTTGKLLQDSAVTVTDAGEILVSAAGGYALPAFSFAGDTDTGVTSAGANILNLVAGGGNRLEVRTSYVRTRERLMVEAGTEAAPSINTFSDQNTGPVWGLSDTWSVSTGGVTAFALDANQDALFAADIDAAGGFRRTISPLWASSPSASSTYTLMPTGAISSTGAYIEALGWFVCPRAGSVVELTAWPSADITVGNAGFFVEKSTDGGDTWGACWGSTGTPVISLNTTDPENNAATQAKDTSVFAFKDMLRVRVTTDGSWGVRHVFASLTIEC